MSVLKLFVICTFSVLALSGCVVNNKIEDEYVNAFINTLKGEEVVDCPSEIEELIKPLKENNNIEVRVYNKKYVDELIAEDPFTFIDEASFTTPEYDDALIERDGYMYIKLGDLRFDNDGVCYVSYDGYLTTVMLAENPLSLSYMTHSKQFDYTITDKIEKGKNKWVFELTSKLGSVCVIDADFSDKDNIIFQPREWSALIYD